MALPNVPFAATTAPQMVFLDQTFAALALCTVIPCAAAGTNVIALTPVTNAPAVTTYTDKQSFGFVAAANSSGNVTMSVAGLATLTLYKAGGATQAGSGDIVLGQYYTVVYLSSLNAFVITSAIIPPSQTAFPVLIVQDRKAAGNNGAAIGNTAYLDRDANTVILNTLVSGGSVSSPNILLPAGTFDLRAELAVSAGGGQNFKSIFVNTTSSAVVQDVNGNDIVSINGQANGANVITTIQVFEQRFTLAAQAQVRFRTQANGAGSLAGVACNMGEPEVYANYKFTKVA